MGVEKQDKSDSSEVAGIGEHDSDEDDDEDEDGYETDDGR